MSAGKLKLKLVSLYPQEPGLRDAGDLTCACKGSQPKGIRSTTTVACSWWCELQCSARRHSVPTSRSLLGLVLA